MYKGQNDTPAGPTRHTPAIEGSCTTCTAATLPEAEGPGKPSLGSTGAPFPDRAETSLQGARFLETAWVASTLPGLLAMSLGCLDLN